MATKKAINSNANKNNGGSVINGGVGSTVLSSTLKSSRVNFGVFGSTVINGVNTAASLTSGRFAKVNKIVATRVSTTLAGTVTNNVLLGGASIPGLVRSIHKLETLRTQRFSTSFRAGAFNLYTGKYSPAPTVAVDSLATDAAATPTRSVPGLLVYKLGGVVPVSSNYKAKTNWFWYNKFSVNDTTKANDASCVVGL